MAFQMSFCDFKKGLEENGFKVGYSKVYDDGGEYIFYKDGIVIIAESHYGFNYCAHVYLEVSFSEKIPNNWVSFDSFNDKMLISRCVSVINDMGFLDEISKCDISKTWTQGHDLSIFLTYIENVPFLNFELTFESIKLRKKLVENKMKNFSSELCEIVKWDYFWLKKIIFFCLL